jgi:hypothetical protein
MYGMSHGLVKLPNDIVTLVKIDDEGHLWFISRRPGYFSTECEQDFPARLCFYRKGYDFYVEVSGKASIVNNSYNTGIEKQDYEADANGQRPVLVKMTMANVEYSEPHAIRPPGWMETMFTNLYKWALRNIVIPRNHKPILSKLPKTPVHG